MNNITAEVEWDGYNWVASVPDVPGAFTQAKRLDAIAERVSEVVKLITGKTVNPDNVSLNIAFSDVEVGDAASEIAALEADLEDLTGKLARQRAMVARRLRDQGFTLRDIGVITHLSHQRVDQLLRGR